MASTFKKNETPYRRSTTSSGGVPKQKVVAGKSATKSFSKCQEDAQRNRVVMSGQKSSWNLCKEGEGRRARSPSASSRSRSEIFSMPLQDKPSRNRAHPKAEALRTSPKSAGAALSGKKQSPAKTDFVQEKIQLAPKQYAGTSISTATQVKRSLIDEAWSALNLMPGCLVDEEPMLLIPPDLPSAFELTRSLSNEECSETSSVHRFGSDDCAFVARTDIIPEYQTNSADPDAADLKGEASHAPAAGFSEKPLPACDLFVKNFGDDGLMTSKACHKDPATTVPSIPNLPFPFTSLPLLISGTEQGSSFEAGQISFDKIVPEEYQDFYGTDERDSSSHASSADRIGEMKHSRIDETQEDGSLFCEREGRLVLNLEALKLSGSWVGRVDSIGRLLKEESVEYDEVSTCSLEQGRNLDSGPFAYAEDQIKYPQEHGFRDLSKVFPISQAEEPLSWPLDMINVSDERPGDHSAIESTSWLKSMPEGTSESYDYLQGNFQSQSGEHCSRLVLPSVEKVRPEYYLPIAKEKPLKDGAADFNDAHCTSMSIHEARKDRNRDIKKSVSRAAIPTQTRVPKVGPLVEEKGGAPKVSRARSRESPPFLTGRKSLDNVQGPLHGLGMKSRGSSHQKLGSSFKPCTGFARRSPVVSLRHRTPEVPHLSANATGNTKQVDFYNAASACGSLENGQTHYERESIIVDTTLQPGQKDLGISLRLGRPDAGNDTLSDCYFPSEARGKDCSVEGLPVEIIDDGFSHVEKVVCRSSNAVGRLGRIVNLSDSTHCIKSMDHCENHSCPGLLVPENLASTLDFAANDDLSGDCIETLVGMAEFDGREGMQECSVESSTSMVETKATKILRGVQSSFGAVDDGHYLRVSLKGRKNSADTQWSLTDVHPINTGILYENLCGAEQTIDGSTCAILDKLVIEQGVDATNKMEYFTGSASASHGNRSPHESLFDENACCLISYSESAKGNLLEEIPASFDVALQEFGRAIEQLTESKLREEIAVSSVPTIKTQDQTELVMPRFQNQADGCPEPYFSTSIFLTMRKLQESCLTEEASLEGGNERLVKGFSSAGLTSIHEHKESSSSCSESQECPVDEVMQKLLFKGSVSRSMDSLFEAQERKEVSTKVIRSLSYGEEEKGRVRTNLQEACPDYVEEESSALSILSPMRATRGGQSSHPQVVKVVPGHESKSILQQKDGKVASPQKRYTDKECHTGQQHFLVVDGLEANGGDVKQKHTLMELSGRGVICPDYYETASTGEGVENLMSSKPFESGCVVFMGEVDEGCEVENMSNTELKLESIAVDQREVYALKSISIGKREEHACVDFGQDSAADNLHSLHDSELNELVTNKEIMASTMADVSFLSSGTCQCFSHFICGIGKCQLHESQGQQDSIIGNSDLAKESDCINKWESIKTRVLGEIVNDDFSMQKCNEEKIAPGVHLRERNTSPGDMWENGTTSSLLIYKNPLWSEELSLDFEKVVHGSWLDKKLLDLPIIREDSKVLPDLKHHGCNLFCNSVNDYWNMAGSESDRAAQALTPHNPLLSSDPLSQDDGLSDTNHLGTPIINAPFDCNSEDFPSISLGIVETSKSGLNVLEDLAGDCSEADSKLNPITNDEDTLRWLETGGEIHGVKCEQQPDYNKMGIYPRKEVKKLGPFAAVGYCPAKCNNGKNVSHAEHAGSLNIAIDGGFSALAQTTKFGLDVEERNLGMELQYQDSFNAIGNSSLTENDSNSEKLSGATEVVEGCQSACKKLPFNVDLTEPDTFPVQTLSYEQNGRSFALTFEGRGNISGTNSGGKNHMKENHMQVHAQLGCGEEQEPGNNEAVSVDIDCESLVVVECNIHCSGFRNMPSDSSGNMVYRGTDGDFLDSVDSAEAGCNSGADSDNLSLKILHCTDHCCTVVCEEQSSVELAMASPHIHYQMVPVNVIGRKSGQSGVNHHGSIISPHIPVLSGHEAGESHFVESETGKLEPEDGESHFVKIKSETGKLEPEVYDQTCEPHVTFCEATASSVGGSLPHPFSLFSSSHGQSPEANVGGNFLSNVAAEQPEWTTQENQIMSQEENQEVERYNWTIGEPSSLNTSTHVSVKLADADMDEAVEDVKQVTYSTCNSNKPHQEEHLSMASSSNYKGGLVSSVVCSIFPYGREDELSRRECGPNQLPVSCELKGEKAGVNQFEKDIGALQTEIFTIQQEHNKLRNLVKENEEIAIWLAREKAAWELQKIYEVQIYNAFDEEKAKQLKRVRHVFGKQSHTLFQLSTEKDRMELEELKAKLLQITEDHLKKEYSWRLMADRFEQVIAVLLEQIQILQQKVKENNRQLSSGWDLQEKCRFGQNHDKDIKNVARDVPSRGSREKLPRETEVTIVPVNSRRHSSSDVVKPGKGINEAGMSILLSKDNKRQHAGGRANGYKPEKSSKPTCRKIEDGAC